MGDDIESEHRTAGCLCVMYMTTHRVLRYMQTVKELVPGDVTVTLCSICQAVLCRIAK
jgi:hypothetical protein